MGLGLVSPRDIQGELMNALKQSLTSTALVFGLALAAIAPEANGGPLTFAVSVIGAGNVSGIAIGMWRRS